MTAVEHLGLLGQADRDNDTPTTPTELPVGVVGFSVGYRGTVIPIADPLCGHLPGECAPGDDECAYWRGVALGEYAPPAGMPGPYDLPGPAVQPAFNLRQLREQHVTAADLERGAA